MLGKGRQGLSELLHGQHDQQQGAAGRGAGATSDSVNRENL